MSSLEDAQAYWQDAPASMRHERSNVDGWKDHDFNGYGDAIARVYDLAVPEHPRRTAIEWGCGGGAVIAALAHRFKRWIGVDVSALSLAAAARTAAECDVEFVPVLVTTLDNPVEVVRERGLRADAAVCLAVIQHLPSWEYAEAVIDALHLAIAKDDPLLIQSRRLKEVRRGDVYEANVCHWLTMEPEKFRALADAHGFECLVSTREESDASGYDWHVMKRR